MVGPRDAMGDVWVELLQAGQGQRLQAVGEEAYQAVRILRGVPEGGSEIDDRSNPMELGLHDAYNLSKGCYTGQEVVARMHSRGRVGHLLVGFELEGELPPEPGDEVSAEGRRVGEVTSACLSPAQGPIALGYVRVARADKR